MSVAAEKVGHMIQQMKAGNISVPREDEPMVRALMGNYIERMKSGQIVYGEIVDMTAIYEEFTSGDTGYHLYEDSMMCPPLDEATFCYYSAEAGYTVAIGSSSYVKGTEQFNYFVWQSDPTVEHVIDWDSVKWITTTSLWVFADDKRMVVGPVMSWRFAVNEDGTTQDIHWINSKPALDMHIWDNALTVYMQSVTWLNCRNVELVSPIRPRAERRRVERYNVDVKEMYVRPIGKTYQGQGSKVGDAAVPLHTVRGHRAKYGIEGRGLLFGKISGVFWIPMTVRGRRENGVRTGVRVIDTQTERKEQA